MTIGPSVRVSRRIDVPAKLAYAAIADYREHHPKIVPRPPFTRVEVEEGGVGSGTIIRVGMRVMGRERVFRMRVLEPEPGRVLVEETIGTGDITTFTVEPEGETRSKVTISTEWSPKKGLAGLGERLFNARVARPIYEKELAQLETYARSLR